MCLGISSIAYDPFQISSLKQQKAACNRDKLLYSGFKPEKEHKYKHVIRNAIRTHREQGNSGSCFMLEKSYLNFFSLIKKNIESKQLSERKEREHLKERRSFILF